VIALLAAVIIAGAPGHGPGIEFRSTGPDSDNVGTCAKPVRIRAATDSTMRHWRVFFAGPPYASPYFDDSLTVARRDTLVVRYATATARGPYPVWQWASAPWRAGLSYHAGCARLRFVRSQEFP
jgi:hypothetical protein